MKATRVGLTMTGMVIVVVVVVVVVVENKGLGDNQRLLSIFIGFSNIYRDRV